MYTLLDSCLDRIDIFEFLKHVEDGLNDHYDIKMLTYLMLVRLAHLCPNAVLQRKSKLNSFSIMGFFHAVGSIFYCESGFLKHYSWLGL